MEDLLAATKEVPQEEEVEEVLAALDAGRTETSALLSTKKS